jgi:outer membrane lipoprotein-sorting protein
MKRLVACGLGVAVVLLSSGAVLADTLETVEKAIVEKAANTQSQQARVTTMQRMQTPQMSYDSQGETTYEFLKQGEKWLSRTESKTISNSSVAGQEHKQNTTMLVIDDGKFVWTLSEMDGQKSVMKSRSEANRALLTDKAYFDNLRKDFELKLLPDETVDGRATWPIQATPRQPASEGMIAMLLNYFDKETGVCIKTIGKDSSGKEVMTSVTKDIKVNPTLAADRFVFKVPEGVTVMDMTQDQPGQPQAQKPAESKPDQPQQPAEPKKEDKPKKPPVKLPKLP